MRPREPGIISNGGQFPTDDGGMNQRGSDNVRIHGPTAPSSVDIQVDDNDRVETSALIQKCLLSSYRKVQAQKGDRLFQKRRILRRALPGYWTNVMSTSTCTGHLTTLDESGYWATVVSLSFNLNQFIPPLLLYFTLEFDMFYIAYKTQLNPQKSIKHPFENLPTGHTSLLLVSLSTTSRQPRWEMKWRAQNRSVLPPCFG